MQAIALGRLHHQPIRLRGGGGGIHHQIMRATYVAAEDKAGSLELQGHRGGAKNVALGKQCRHQSRNRLERLPIGYRAQLSKTAVGLFNWTGQDFVDNSEP